jgi:hypothetical protein
VTHFGKKASAGVSQIKTPAMGLAETIALQKECAKWNFAKDKGVPKCNLGTRKNSRDGPG